MSPDTTKLFDAFTKALSHAWIKDLHCPEVSDRALKEAWDKERQAREALIKRIEELEQVLAHDSAP